MKEKPTKQRPPIQKQLTPNQDTFCNLHANPEPVGAETAADAYMRAFPNCKSERSAKQGAYQLLRNENVRDRIREIQGRNAQQLEIKAERVLAELARISFANVTDYVRWDAAGNVEWIPSDQLSEESKAAIKEVIGVKGRDGRRIKLHDKVGALDKLAKYLGLFTEKVDVTSGGQPIAALTHEERVERVVALFESTRTRTTRSDVVDADS